MDLLINGLFDNLYVYEKGLDIVSKKNSIIVNNIANVDTKDFKASDLSFEEEFKKALSSDSGISSSAAGKRNPKHFDISLGGSKDVSAIEGEVVTNEGSSRLDGNSVDIDAEMTKFVDNIIRYNYIIQKVNSEISNLKTAIGEGRS